MIRWVCTTKIDSTYRLIIGIKRKEEGEELVYCLYTIEGQLLNSSFTYLTNSVVNRVVNNITEYTWFVYLKDQVTDINFITAELLNLEEYCINNCVEKVSKLQIEVLSRYVGNILKEQGII